MSTLKKNINKFLKMYLFMKIKLKKFKIKIINFNKLHKNIIGKMINSKKMIKNIKVINKIFKKLNTVIIMVKKEYQLIKDHKAYKK